MSVRSFPERPPRSLPGYQEALVNNQIPLVPATAPVPAPIQPTAHHEFERLLRRSVPLVFLAVLIPVSVANSDLPALFVTVCMLGPGLLAFWLIVFRFLKAVGVRNTMELERGYTTLTFTFGGFGWRESRRWKQTGHRTPWDYRGIWTLDRTGSTVVSPPDRNVDPPGYYPSPNRAGAFELWTGVAWSGHYRD